MALERGLSTWIDSRRADGWAADYTSLDTRGFPNRFDTTITDLRLADPVTGLAWTMPFFQILALSYQPNHVIAVLPDQQTVATPFEQIDIQSELIRGSVRFRADTDLALERSDFVADAVVLNGSTGWSAALDQGRFAIHRQDLADARYRIGADVVALTPAEEMRRALDPTGRLPAVIETLKLDATLEFTRPWGQVLGRIRTATANPRRT